MESHKKAHSSWSKILLLVLFVCAILFFTMKDTYESVFAVLSTLRLRDILCLIVCSALMYVISGIILTLLAKKSIPDYPLIEGIRTSFITMFTSNVFFSASSKLVQYYLFYAHKVKADAATCVIAVEFLSYQILMLILTLSMMVVCHPMFQKQLPNEIWLAWFGTLISLLPMLALCLLWWKPAQNVVIAVLAWLVDKLHLSLNIEEWKTKLQVFMDTMIQIKDTYRKDHWLILQLFLWNLLRHIVKHGIVIVIALILRLPMDLTLACNLFLFSMFLDLWLTAIPIAGKHGVAEMGFITIFSVLIGDVSASAMMLLWRFVSFYSNTILGGLFLVTSPDISMEKIRELKEKK